MITELEFKSLASEGYNRIPLMLEALDRRRDLCVDDALYVALADHLKVPLVTRGRAMAASCSRAILVQATSGWGGAEGRQDFLSE